jgi:hypothetical protein
MLSKIKYYTLVAIVLGLWFVSPRPVLAAVDLGVRASDISFSTNSFVSGQKATVYVKVRSAGDEDASGMVNLYLNNELLAAGLAVSVVSSEPDTVYSEFTVPDKNFKISVDLKNVFPSDSQLSNNNAITSEQTVDIDTDHDGIGDMKDTDDDNDGLSDSDEARLGTNPKKIDTDGDGGVEHPPRVLALFPCVQPRPSAGPRLRLSSVFPRRERQPPRRSAVRGA